MGDHYIPRFYLKGFTQKPTEESIWAYRKSESRFFRASVRKIAQQNKFYSPEMEQYLANEVEEPANRVIHKIKEQQKLTDEDKLTLSRYMMVLWKRVPQGLKWVHDKAPEIMGPVFERISRELTELAEIYPSKANLVEKRLKELQRLQENKPDKLIYEIWLDNIPPEKTPQSVDVLSQMTWRFLLAKEDQYYLTSDNPLFFFKWMGIGKEKSEVTFPITSNIALWATWRIDINEGYYPVRSQVVKEINRRTVSISTEYLFSPYPADWIGILAEKRKHRLNRII